MELDGSNVGPVSESQPKDVKARVKQEPIDPVVLPKGQRTGTTGTAIRGEPIAPNLGVDYAFPPHLEYAYPPPDGNILTNIVNALIAVPRFYTQVLHLMNKMNLPAPFRPALPTPPLPPPAPAQIIPKRQAGDLSSGESELESSEEEEDSELDGTFPDTSTSEKDAEKKGSSRKRMKREAILGPALDKGASHEAAGLKTITVSKGLTIKKRAPVLQIKITPKGTSKEPAEEAKEPEVGQPEVADEPAEQRTTATQEELEAGKLHASDMLSLPIFKNYASGNPTQVLYIKNLSKDVTAEDLYYVYGAFFSSRSEAMQLLSIKLMQEGRMRGQAFVYWPSVDLAKIALAGSHGYMLKGKPMVVQFGRNQAAFKADVAGTSTRADK
ncbi:U11/U12 small nuclear ribonucleoprotein 65 kDa protein [Marchantia polymorpha subsp. ruderalis]|uniref:RRM domain-containing protein n=4 Tax=Marchantia polymorpha TaxID=3197 RepID=A0A176VCB8_MARPO|nr:hypothetical protein AXG93_406s1310 [Marchantia polymorpha subsp. ruderalis]PTQ37902.1 hypothetical protein MARPO_0054s0019 [Marchantia polymorpha]BBN08916.1 hypothetical protein Mp_4g15540 [Marchantia polymorpha subsp. ruderalis]|eukprot:PTQ37902.1 hypothetical protein MARPO_0054s0019 [Marchantia polymorpha]